MDFFNSLTVRMPLAVLGGILYGLLTYATVLTLNVSSETATCMGVIVFFLYLGSRLLILFSGIDTPYYSRQRKGSPYEHTPFYQTAQWVGIFYRYHDFFLLAFLAILAIAFILSLIMDGIEHRPFGQTLQNLWEAPILKK